MGTPSYRNRLRLGPDPVTEAEIITELVQRADVLRRRLLTLTLAAATAGGAAAAGVTLVTPRVEALGPQAGALFTAGALLTFTAMRRLSERVARRREALWIADLAHRHDLDPEALTEALSAFANG